MDVARHSDAVLLAIRAAAPDLVELQLQPVLAATARFGLVTLRRRTEPPALELVRMLMQELLRDPPKAGAGARARARPSVMRGPLRLSTAPKTNICGSGLLHWNKQQGCYGKLCTFAAIKYKVV